MYRKKKPFTLLELLLVLFLISSVAAVAGFQFVRAVEEQKFLTEAYRMKELLQRAQEITRLTHAETAVLFSREGRTGPFHASFRSEAALPKGVSALLSRPQKPFKSLSRISFDKKEVEEGRPLLIRFFPFGNESGLLTLEGAQQKRMLFIPPSPAPLALRQEAASPIEFPRNSLYPKDPFLPQPEEA